MVDGGFVDGGAEIAQGGMQPAGVVPALDVFEHGAVQPGDRGPWAGSMSSFLIDENQLSDTALSQRSQLWPNDHVTPISAASSA